VTLSPELPTSTDPLEAMLADPETRQALAVIVANAPTLAALSAMASALLQRGPEIADNVNELVRQLRVEGAGDENAIGGAIGSLASLAPLAPALAERTDTITSLLDSPVLAPEVVQVIGRVGQAAVEADAQTRGKQAQVGGAFAILRELKDPGVQEGLAFLFAFAKAFGREQSKA
jgi:hypothetical protein